MDKNVISRMSLIAVSVFVVCSLFSCKEKEDDGLIIPGKMTYEPIEIEYEGINLETPNETDYVGVVDAGGSDFIIIGLDGFSFVTECWLKYNDCDIDFSPIGSGPNDPIYKIEGDWGSVEYEEHVTVPYKMHFHINGNDSGVERVFKFCLGIDVILHYSYIVLTQPPLTEE